MAKGTLEVQVISKVIQQQPLEDLIVKGEMNAADVIFVLDRYVNGVDLAAAGMSYQIFGVNSNNQSAFNLLTKDTHDNPDKFKLKWTIGQQFTVADGALTLWLNVTKSEANKVVFNWESKPARIFVKNGFIAAEYISATEQFLIDLGTYLSQAQAAATAAGNSATMAATSETNAKNSATGAKTSENAAKASETSAKTSQTNSANNATAAASSATQAANSAIAAKASEKNAKDSEDNASSYAQSAQSYAQQAQQIKDSTEMEYDVQQVRVGFKRKDESSFTYTGDLTGPIGPQGIQGIQGPQGLRGEKGERGESGLSVSANGLFTLYVSDSGNLICRYDDQSEPPKFAINEDGCLIWSAANP